ncbi:MAG TPA: diacylglycerol kinase family protein [Spirochaetota bacterium]|nr:diacylglycerol kinase family protein [Spirochaetota bacterium]HPF04423.1 diacylglycerol kinase family protein [Spirochaetota bacterium]HPJ40805.1 diacylglycerol kinase family protein [Spirochaetota bacterium]HPR36074.1 diacylglycerol kinase family protein [Spirochaetota bacterium]HRX45988.1 diacylglycerol kinase family protein [Spirochaetota bacterium]
MQNKKDIRVIINPNAKKFRTGRASFDCYRKLESDMVSIITPSTLDELHSAADLMAKEKPDYICIAGGDGTLHVVLSSIINSFQPEPVPPVLILKEGTMDNVARTINLKGRGPQLLQRLINAVNTGNEIEIHKRTTMKINNMYCFLFGTGFITNFLREAYSGKEKGFIRNIQVALMSAKEALSNSSNGKIFREMFGEVYIDDKKIDINPVHGLLAGTVEHIGMGFSPMPGAAYQEGAFEAIIVGLKPSSIIMKLNRLRTGKIIKSDKYLKCHGKKIRMNYDHSYDYTMDGDIYQAIGELIVETGPAVNLVKV